MTLAPAPTPDVSVCIVNWNGGHLVAAAATSALDSCGDLVPEVIVVDNASTDDSVAYLRATVPSVRIIANQSNVGFARANNQAFALAHGRYVVLLNDDAVFRGSALASMVRFAAARPHVGIVGCQVQQPEGIIQLTFGPVPTLRRILWKRGTGQAEEQEMAFGPDLARRQALMQSFVRKRQLDVTHEVEYVSGVCLLARREVLERVGPLDEGYFMYYEDIDWCLRTRAGGWKVYYLAEAVVEHHLAPLSAKHESPGLALAARRAQRRFVRKYSGLPAAVTLTVVAIVQFVARALITVLTSRRADDAKAWLRAGVGMVVTSSGAAE